MLGECPNEFYWQVPGWKIKKILIFIHYSRLNSSMITRELIENYIDKSLEKVRIDCEWYPLIYVKYKKYAHLYPDMIYAFCVALNHIAPQTN